MVRRLLMHAIPHPCLRACAGTRTHAPLASQSMGSGTPPRLGGSEDGLDESDEDTTEAMAVDSLQTMTVLCHEAGDFLSSLEFGELE